MAKRKRLVLIFLCCALAAAAALCAILLLNKKDGGDFVGYPRDEGSPYLIKPEFGGEAVVADILITDPPYYADPTGQEDASAAIQRALDDCRDDGGGTVWMPAGKYLVTAPLKIPAFVTLRGDWNDPDKGGEYGTVILAGVPSTNDITPGLFTIAGSAGVRGLTIYYPGQSLSDVKPYPFTFYVPGAVGGEGHYMLQSVVDCTVINGYRGVGACVAEGVHEMMTIENLKGTFLSVGAEAYNQADVGTWKNVVIDNRYWAEARGGLSSADRAALDAYTAENASGLVLGDLEWTQFTGISVADRAVGIHIVKGKRIEFAGSIFDITVKNCGVGLLVDSIDERWGMVLAKGSIEGRTSAVVNNTGGTVKLAGVTLSGGAEGEYIETDGDSLDSISPASAAAPAPKAALWDAVKFYGADNSGAGDAAPSIQRALDDASAAGGGIVYLRAGQYRLEQPISVPAGVELRGCSSVALRSQNDVSLGTLLLAYYGEAGSGEEALSMPALVTLAGENSGISGLYIICPENPPTEGAVKPWAFAVRGGSKGVYAVNISVAAAYNGIDFRGADNHVIKKLVIGSYSTSIYAGNSEGGIIEGCLQNGTVTVRQALGFDPWIAEGDIFKELFDPITRQSAVFLRLEDSRGQTVSSVFAYGVSSLIEATDSRGLVAVNIGADNIGPFPMLKFSGGGAVVVNMLRYNGDSYENDGAELSIYNRISIREWDEENIK